MALTDLLNNITSFDYTQVGQPQSFEANGRLVTGQQTFDRPIEEPLPITETQVGYNTRDIQATQGINLFNDDFASGFTPNADVLNSQFNFLDIEAKSSSLIPKNSFIGDFDYGWASSTEPLAVDFLNNTYVEGFKINRAPSNFGPGTSDMTQTFNPSLTYKVPNNESPITNTLQTGGSYTEYSSFIDTYVEGFKRNRAPQNGGPGTSDIKGLDLDNNTSDFVPTTNDTYKWSDKDTPFAVNFFDKFGSTSYSSFRLPNTNIPNQEDSYVSGFVKDKVGQGAFKGITDFTDLAEQFATKIKIGDSVFGTGTIGNAKQISSVESGPLYDRAEGNVNFRQDSKFIKNMELKKSRFFPQGAGSETPILNYYMNNVAIKVDNPFATGEQPTEFSIAPANQSFQYTESFVGGGVGNTKQISYSAGETLQEYAESRLKNRDQFIKFEKGKPNSEEFAETKDYVDFVRDVSYNPGIGFRQPFIVRKQGQEWGFDGNEENQDGFSFGSIVDAIDGIGSAFYRGATGFSGLLDREIQDKIRVGKYYLNNIGLFSLKQFVLQSQNPSIHTRIWNPFSLLSDNTFIRFNRHLGGDFIDPLPLPGTIKDFIKKAIPIDFEPWLTSSIIHQAEAGEELAAGGVTPQAPAAGDEPTGRFGRFVAAVGDAIDSATSLKQYKHLVLTDKPHYLSINLPGPLSKLKDRKRKLQSGFTFSNKFNGQLNTQAGFNQQTKPLAGGFPDEGAQFVGAYMGGKYDFLGDNDFEFAETGILNADETNVGQSGIGEDATTSGLSVLGESAGYQTEGYEGLGDQHDDSIADIVMQTAEGRALVMKTAPEVGMENTLLLRNSSKPYKRQLSIRVPGRNSKKDLAEYKEELYNTDRLFKTSEGLPSPGAIDPNTHDTVNATPITNVQEGTGLNSGQDFVNFQFRVTQYNEEGKPERRFLKFRATFADINDTITPQWNETKFIGRSDKVYTYSGTDREIQLSFKIFPKSIVEFPFLVEKLNMLAGANYPQYTKSDFMIGPLVDMKIGDMYDFIPGYMTSFSMNIVESSTWEIDLFEFPKNIDVSLGFRYIGKRRPHGLGAQFDIPYFNVNKTNQSNTTLGLEGDQALESPVYNGSMYLTQKEMDAAARQNGTRGDTPITNRAVFGYEDFISKSHRQVNNVDVPEPARPDDAQGGENPQEQTNQANEPAEGTNTEGGQPAPPNGTT
tara:strand:- start:408 stop:3995 length:3588 start_codon:yes stop_codon:yes gene_type:complete